MDNALHPLDERYIDAYAIRETTGTAAQGVSRLRCPFCLGELFLTHRQRRGYGYYKHTSDEDGARCPLTTTGYHQESLVGRGPQGPQGLQFEQLHRTRFLTNWKRHFRIARSEVPSLTIARFTALIECADVLNLWSSARVDIRDLPYVLLVLGGFMVVRGEEEQKAWVRFLFDGNVRETADIWRPDAPVARLFRVTYRGALHTPFPTSAEIMHWEQVARIERLEDVTTPGVNREEKRAFDHFAQSNAAARLGRRESLDE
jgi:hypothetical protein